LMLIFGRVRLEIQKTNEKCLEKEKEGDWCWFLVLSVMNKRKRTITMINERIDRRKTDWKTEQQITTLERARKEAYPLVFGCRWLFDVL
jgi:hypothetical protein